MAGRLNTKKKPDIITLSDSDDDKNCLKSKPNRLTKSQSIEIKATQNIRLPTKKTAPITAETSDEDETFNQCTQKNSNIVFFFLT